MTQKKQFTKTLMAQAMVILMASFSSTGFAQTPLPGALPGSIPGVSTTPPGVPNGTNPSGSSSATCVAPACVDLYASTIGAINNAYLYPTLLPSSIAGTYYSLASFTGGTLIPTGTTTVVVPASNPTNAVMFSQNTMNCGSKSATATVILDVNENSTTTIESDSTTSSSNTSSLGGETSVSLTLTAGVPDTDSVSGTVAQTFNYGTTATTESSASLSNSSTGGSSVDFNQTVDIVVPAYSSILVQVTDSLSQVAGASWTQPVILSGNTTGQFQQQYINTAPVTWLSGGTGGVDAYQAFMPTVWYGPSGLFSSPNGVYSMAVSALVNTNEESQFYTQALTAVNTNYSGNFYGAQSNVGLVDFNLLELAGIPSVWLGTPSEGLWGVNIAVSSLIINNNGAVQALNAGGGVIWQNSINGGAAPWSNVPINQNTGNNVVGYLGANASPPMTSLTNLTPTQLLGSNPVFTASGTYSSTTYTGSGNLIYYDAVALTPSQCGVSSFPTANTTPEQEISAPRLMNVSHTSNSQAVRPTMMYASYTPEFNQPQFMKVQHDVRRDANGRIISRTDDQRTTKEQGQNNRNNPPAQLKPNTENSDLKRAPKIFTKISLPYRFSDQEFYANKDAVVKVTITRGDNLTTALRFTPGPQEVMSDPKIIKKFRMKVLEKKVFTKK